MRAENSLRLRRWEGSVFQPPVTTSISPFYQWMERLDRWGYITVGISLLAIGMIIFANSWLEFSQVIPHNTLLHQGLTLVNNLLLVVILLELFRTIVRFLETEVMRIEPYLAVGVIACIRRMLTASAELGDLRSAEQAFFENYLKDMGINALLVIVLITAIFMLRGRPFQTGSTDVSRIAEPTTKP